MTQLNHHEIRSKIPGDIKAILKQKGEAVRNMEPVMYIQNPNLVRIEALADMQHKNFLYKGRKVDVEPYQPKSPIQVLTGHFQEVNGVAVSNDPKDPQIVSVGEDGTLRIWDRGSSRDLWILSHPSPSGVIPLKSVACTPRTAADAELCFTGGNDGSGRIWNLATLRKLAANRKEVGKKSHEELLKEVSVELADRHRGPINRAAFSPNGKFCVTGGEDRQIRVWNAVTGALEYNFEAGHRGRVTYVQFTPDVQPDYHLVSAGGDSTLIYWQVGAKSAQRIPTRFDHRSGNVTAPGVSLDGKRVLFDLGKELRVLTLPDGQTEGVLQYPSASVNFTTMAQFSPNGKVILATAASEGRLQLWRAPEGKSRAYEFWHLVWTGAAATCGAFSPDGSFVVTGMKDRQVLVWPVPGENELNREKLTATIALSERLPGDQWTTGAHLGGDRQQGRQTHPRNDGDLCCGAGQG